MKAKFIKKSVFHFLFGIVIVLFSFSCEKNVVLTEEDMKPEELPVTRALSYDVPSTSNPTLHSDWENVERIYLNKGGYTDPPWIIKQGSSNDIPLSYVEDIKKSDGWTMLSHTIIATGSADPDYIIFYNSKRGLLKVFYHNPERVANQSLLWTVEANTPTSILPSNELAQGTFNSTNKYATTSNVINESAANFGQLSYGWNMFTMELPYGETNSNPIIAIRAYNSVVSKIALGGKFTGEVTINLPKESSSSQISSIVSALGKIPGVDKIPGFTTVSSAVSFLGQLGSSSLFTSKEGKTTAVKGTTAGTIELTGNSFTEFGGGVASLVNIDIKKINNQAPLGLWTLKEMPNYNYEETNLSSIYSTEKWYKYNYETAIYMLFKTPNYTKLEDMIVINPTVKNSISSYSTSIKFFTRVNPYGYDNSQIYTNIYNLESPWISCVKAIGTFEHTIPAHNLTAVLTRHFKTPIYASITVKFTYTDGSKFESTKNFKISTTPVNTNQAYIENMIKNRTVIYLN